jgi:hypothetical protein
VVTVEIRQLPENSQKYIRSLEDENNILREKLRLTSAYYYGKIYSLISERRNTTANLLSGQIAGTA